ncbi:hypothetical protein STANM309S_00736 [Streptomyces tanashiensis]
MQDATPAPGPDARRQREIADAFLAAAHGGDFEGLLAVLDPDVVLRADGGRTLAAVSQVVRGAEAVIAQALTYAKFRTDTLRVHPEGDGVDEGPPRDRAQVDPELLAVAQRVEAAGRVGAVEAQVQGEVVAGAGRHHQERQVVLGGDLGHQRLRAVAAGHPEQIGALGHGLPGQPGDIRLGGPGRAGSPGRRAPPPARRARTARPSRRRTSGS